MKAVTHALALGSSRRVPTEGSCNGFFVPNYFNRTGGITHPSMRLKRPIRINVASLACVSWVSIPRGRENWSYSNCCASAVVSLDKRELLSPVDNTVDNLPTDEPVGWMSYVHKKKKIRKEYGNHTKHITQ